MTGAALNPHGGGAPPTCPHFNPLAPLDELQDVLHGARRDRPVFYYEPMDMWVVTRYADVKRVLTDVATFSQNGMMELVNTWTPEVRALLDSAPAPWNSTIFLGSYDGPEFPRLRKSINRTFTPRAIARVEDPVRDLATALIDRVHGQGRMEFVEDFANPFPAEVILLYLGYDRADIDQLRSWSDDAVQLWVAPMGAEEQLRCAQSMVTFQRYALAQMQARRMTPTDDLLTDLVREVDREDGATLTAGEVVMLASLVLMLAGHETTKGQLTNAVYRLLDDPVRWQALQDDHRLIPVAVDEALRYDPTHNGIFRTVIETVELGGVVLPAGAKVWWLSTSANRDAEQFDKPDEFSVERTDASDHLTFGHGLHFCIGAQLAKMEMRVALEQLVDRLPTLRLADDVDWELKPNPIQRHMTRLPLEWVVG